jgi:HSP20 family protein
MAEPVTHHEQENPMSETNTAIQKTEPQRVTVRPAGSETRSEGAWTYMPQVDVLDNADEVVIVADVPGTSLEHVDVTYERGLLTLRAAVPGRYPENTRFLRQEFGVGGYHRRFRVEDGIDASRIWAEYDSGVLTVHLPKQESAQRRRIPIKTS